jgi:opacity protein-like surface antigen
MKKFTLIVGAFLVSTLSFGQGSDTPMSLEGVLSFNGSSVEWSAPTLRFRYFVNENIAGRVQLGIGDGNGTPMSESWTFYENGDGTGAQGTAEISRAAWNAQIGGEYHISATDRLSPYFMLGINFGGGSYSETWSESDGTSYVQDLAAQVDADFSMFGVGIGGGVDFYLVENLYAGVELGLAFNSMNFSDQTVEVTTGGTTTTSIGGNAKMSTLGTGATSAAFRLGWRF